MTHLPRLTLVGDGIENPHNARTLRDAAAMFGSDCVFHDRAKLVASWRDTFPDTDTLSLVAAAEIGARYDPNIAFDTLPHAASIYGFRLPHGAHPAVIVGNERRGIAHEIRQAATDAVQIPLASRTLTSLNVAAAAGVALYYLARGTGGGQSVVAQPGRRRPDVLFVGGNDHWELGSAIRSAGAFGWERLLLEDRGGAWFGVERATRAEGRAAARRAKNAIRLLPAAPHDRYAYTSAVVVTSRSAGVPLSKANLAGGARQLVAIPDEAGGEAGAIDWRRLTGDKPVIFARVEVPVTSWTYHYRLVATIALAEIARQVGVRSTEGKAAARRRAPRYDAAFPLLRDPRGELVHLDDLTDY